MIPYSPEHHKRLEPITFEAVRQRCLDFIRKYYRKSPSWHTCYSLKQPLTSRLQDCYLYEADMYFLLKELGFAVKWCEQQGRPLAKVTLASRLLEKDADLFSTIDYHSNLNFSHQTPIIPCWLNEEKSK